MCFKCFQNGLFRFDLCFHLQFISSIGNILEKPTAPQLILSNVRTTKATLTFESEHQKNDVIYSLRYRKDSRHDDDDEKESEWKECSIRKGVDQYTLNGLSPETKYQLTSRYQLVQNQRATNVWSEYSDIVPIVTLKFEIPKFEWDPLRKNAAISLSNDNRTFKYDKTFKWVTIMAKPRLSSQAIVSVAWELTVRAADHAPSFQIGFIQKDVVDSITMEGDISDISEIKSKLKSIVFYVSKKTDATKVYENGKQRRLGQSPALKIGDRISFILDLAQSTANVYYNGGLWGEVTKQLPNDLYIVANPYRAVTLETTKFEIVPRK